LNGVEECYRGKQVRVFRLDREGVIARLRSAAARLLSERDDVLGVWLFGSLARGDAAPGSDADLLIVVGDGAGPFLERSPSLAPYFQGAGVGCDLLVYTESEVARLGGVQSVVKTALAEGVQLANGESQPMPRR
jgi:predicted nucleotidyltransferase